MSDLPGTKYRNLRALDEAEKEVEALKRVVQLAREFVDNPGEIEPGIEILFQKLEAAIRELDK